jgi:hypothetical protein
MDERMHHAGDVLPELLALAAPFIKEPFIRLGSRIYGTIAA